MVRVKDLVKTYHLEGLEVPALRRLSLTVEAGAFVAIMGPSGCGKSTLLNLLGCLDRPDEGTLEIDGVDVSRMSRADLAHLRSRKIGFVFQTFHLLSRATALSNVMLPFVYSGYPHDKRRPRAEELLSYVGLQDRMKHRPNQMSGGQQQRVAIARALANDPQILLADEPTGNLDSRSGLEITALLERLNREGKTIIMVTHNRELAEHAERIFHLLDGVLIRDEVVVARRSANELVGAVAGEMQP
ncbi:MAG: ABC transporter ATP-binding protein [Candidatus Rokubacteria bacterium]|nr:ABC transporter ATP-binding protein [Candidatus Rokubacteria bacterium]MBI3824858.1 ABC transporter ATP-binding protein [Candidatus Rokubacteria bacterium]